jgi:hypothetical protein
MKMYGRIGVALVFFLFAGGAQAADKDKEPSAIVEIGGASEWSLQNGAAVLGPSIAVEIEPIKEWLELEAGFTPLFRHDRCGAAVDVHRPKQQIRR